VLFQQITFAKGFVPVAGFFYGKIACGLCNWKGILYKKRRQNISGALVGTLKYIFLSIFIKNSFDADQTKNFSCSF